MQKKHLESLRDSLLDRRITMDEIRATPERYVMIFRPSMAQDDFDDQLPANAKCIYSYWSGYLEKPHWPEFKAKLDAVQGEFVKAHTSGHIFAEDIRDFIENIDSQKK